MTNNLRTRRRLREQIRIHKLLTFRHLQLSYLRLRLLLRQLLLQLPICLALNIIERRLIGQNTDHLNPKYVDLLQLIGSNEAHDRAAILLGLRYLRRLLAHLSK